MCPEDCTILTIPEKGCGSKARRKVEQSTTYSTQVSSPGTTNVFGKVCPKKYSQEGQEWPRVAGQD